MMKYNEEVPLDSRDNRIRELIRYERRSPCNQGHGADEGLSEEDETGGLDAKDESAFPQDYNSSGKRAMRLII
jgi:hypothetical protein